MNTGDPWPSSSEAKDWVLRMQTKLHRWATDDPVRRFEDLFNLVIHPCFLTVAWERVRGNRGARSAGVDGVSPRSISASAEAMLTSVRADLTATRFRPLPVRERLIPKPGSTTRRRLGIPTTRDRVVQAALKLVLEPIFEADFKPCSYGFRPRRRAQDAIAEIHYLASRSYEWVLEADIEACFDTIEHTALMDRVRGRVTDKRVLSLVKAFLKAGVLREDGASRETITGTPQGGILSPLLANIALSPLDEHFSERWAVHGGDWRRRAHRLKGGATYRLVRYADDFVVLVAGTRQHTEALRAEVAQVLEPVGLRLADSKTRICHIDEGFDFLGFRIQRRRKRGTDEHAIYTYPSKRAIAAVKAKVRALTNRARHRTLNDLLRRLNPLLRGWCAYFQHGVSKRTFGYIDHFVFWRVVGWIRKRHVGLSWRALRRRYLPGWEIQADGIALVLPRTRPVSRYRYRGSRIPTPWASTNSGSAAGPRLGLVESRMQ